MVCFVTAITTPIFNIYPILTTKLHSWDSCECNCPFVLKNISFDIFYSFRSGLRDPLACSLLGYQSQNSGYEVTRLCTFLLRIMCYFPPSTDGSGPPLSPPSGIPPHQAPYFQSICLRVNLSLHLLTPLRPFVVYSPSRRIHEIGRASWIRLEKI